MQMIRTMVAALALATTMCSAEVIYVLDSVKDNIVGANITWSNALPDWVLVGTNNQRMTFRYLPSFINSVVAGSYVSKPHPDWSGAAVSNLHMGDLDISNVSNLSVRSIQTWGEGTGNALTGYYAALGYNKGIRMQNLALSANGNIYVGYVDNTGQQLVYRGRGNMLGGHVKGVRQQVGSAADSLYGGAFQWTSGGDESLQYVAADCGWNIGGKMTHATQDISVLAGVACLNWGAFSDYQYGYQIMTNGSYCSWNVGGNNINSNAYSYVFGTNMVSHLGNEIVSPTFWVNDIPYHPMHAVPRWWVSNEICKATNHFATVVFPGLAASAAETRAGILHNKFIPPDSLTNILYARNGAYSDPFNSSPPGGRINISGGDGNVSVTPWSGYRGGGGSIDLSGGLGDGGSDPTFMGGMGGNIYMRGGRFKSTSPQGYGSDAGSIYLDGSMYSLSTGGSIVSTGGVNGAGGWLNMEDGGGSINTKAGTIQLGRSGSRITMSKGTHGDIAVSLPTEAGKIALVSDVVSNQEARSATPYETRNLPVLPGGDPLTNKYISPYSLTNIILARGDGVGRMGKGGCVDISGGTNMVFSHPPGRGGSIIMRGGSVVGATDFSFATANAGDINLSGGNSKFNTHPVAGGPGGSIYLQGVSYQEDNFPYGGGSLISTGGVNGAGGTLHMADGGGSLNTRADVDAPFLTVGRSSQSPYPMTKASYLHRMQFLRLGAGNVFFQAPPSVSGGSTCMYTVAQSPLDMAGKNIVNVLNAVYDQDVPSWKQVQDSITANLFLPASPDEARNELAMQSKGLTPYSLVTPGTSGRFLLKANDGTSEGGTRGGYGGTIGLVGGGAGTGSSGGTYQQGGDAGIIEMNGGEGGNRIGSFTGGKGGNGGLINMSGGHADNAVGSVVGGDGGDGGEIYLVGGNAKGQYEGGSSGQIDLRGGPGDNSANVAGANGGSLFMLGGSGASSGGDILTAGSEWSYDSPGGSIDTRGGDGVLSLGGTIDTRGGSADECPGGSIKTSGGTYYGSEGGSIDTSADGSYSGGSIDTSGRAVPSGQGGSINTSAGGGSIDTTAGTIGLGIFGARTTISKHSLATVDSTLYVPGSMVGNNGTVMTTVATVHLNMNGKSTVPVTPSDPVWTYSNRIVNLPDLPLPEDASFPQNEFSAINYRQITNLIYLMSLQTTPIGTIQAFGGTTPPSGWLWCDGQGYNYVTSPEYARLYATIVKTYGSPGANQFNVPDLRGRFVRGADNYGLGDANRDPTESTRTTPVGADAGSKVGSSQNDAVVSHTHTLTVNHDNTAPYGFGTNPGGSTPRGAVVNATFAWDSWAHTGTANGSGVLDDTHPKNVYVRYIIRYK